MHDVDNAMDYDAITCILEVAHQFLLDSAKQTSFPDFSDTGLQTTVHKFLHRICALVDTEELDDNALDELDEDDPQGSCYLFESVVSPSHFSGY